MPAGCNPGGGNRHDLTGGMSRTWRRARSRWRQRQRNNTNRRYMAQMWGALTRTATPVDRSLVCARTGRGLARSTLGCGWPGPRRLASARARAGRGPRSGGRRRWHLCANGQSLSFFVLKRFVQCGPHQKRRLVRQNTGLGWNARRNIVRGWKYW